MSTKLWIFSLLCLTTVLCQQQELCTLENPLPDVTCTQSERKQIDGVGGWIVSCVKQNSTFFQMDVSMNKQLTVQCRDEFPFEAPFQKCFGLGKLKQVTLIDCLTRNVSFDSVFFPNELESLTIKATHNDIRLKPVNFKNTNFTHLEFINVKAPNFLNIFFHNLPFLEKLVLKNNSLTSIPDMWFEDLKSLVYLEITDNNLSHLKETPFVGLDNLQTLILKKNQIQVIHPLAFTHFNDLRMLDLSNNNLTELPQVMFKNFSRLTTLRLLFNKLESLPANLFENASLLEELDLSYNPLNLSLPQDLLKGLLALKRLKMKTCNLSSIPSSFFSWAPNLEEVSLWNNEISKLDSKTFIKNEKLLLLDLRSNELVSLAKDTFYSQTELRELNLGQNNLTALPDKLFDMAINLKILRLDQNGIAYVDGKLFRNLHRLEKLDLGDNQIVALAGPLSFGKSISLRDVNLSYNNLTLFNFNELEAYKELKTVNLIGNKFKQLELSIGNMGGSEIFLQNNQIATVRLLKEDKRAKFTNETRFPKIHLAGNPFICDCQLLPFVNYITNHNHPYIVSDTKDLLCYNHVSQHLMRVLAMSQAEFICPITDDCMPQCFCYQRGLDNTVVVNCNNQKLIQLPKVLPKNSSVLHIENNGISDIKELQDKPWQNLTQLYLRNNLISSSNLLYLPPNLDVLDLRGNNLDEFPKSLHGGQLIASHWGQVYLGGNPWKCDCEAKEFKIWLTENNQKIRDINQIFCKAPFTWPLNTSSENSTLVIKVPDNILCPAPNSFNTILIVLFTIAIFLVISFLILAIFYYKYKMTILSYIYIHHNNLFKCFFNKAKLDENKTYDAFVSYGQSDNQLANELLKQLEPDFKLCIHERDWLLGNPISWNIINSVQNSRKTVLVLSKEFLNSTWFKVEYHTACFQMLEDKIDRLIVIVHGELPPKETLDKELRILLSTKTYLVWGERWFWEKLRYAMRKGNVKESPGIIPFSQPPNKKHVKTVEDEMNFAEYRISDNQRQNNNTTCTIIEDSRKIIISRV